MKVNQDYHYRAKELDRGFGGDSNDGFDADLSTYGRNGTVLGVVIGAYGETSDDVDVITEAVQRSSPPKTAASTLTRSRGW